MTIEEFDERFSKFPLTDKEGALTFVGVCRRYFFTNPKGKAISADWHSEKNTLLPYINAYMNVILPRMDYTKALSSFTKGEMDTLLKDIQEEKGCTDERLLYFKRAIWKVYKAGFENGHYVDKLGWTDCDKPEDPKERAERELIRKSFSIDEEKRFIDWCKSLEPDKASGAEIGICCMFFNGLRNAEACGLCYEDLKVVKVARPFYVFYVHQTTAGQTNDLKNGGKTSNMFRKSPVFDFFANFLLKRKMYIMKALDLSSEEVDRLPICNRGVDFKVRCDATDLTSEGKLLFDRLGITNSDGYKELDDEMKGLSLKFVNGTGIAEKEPTTYILRRNYATHISALPLMAGEKQYLMGHEIEVDGEKRSDYSNDDKLVSINESLALHPYHTLMGCHSSNSVEITGKGKHTVLIYSEEPLCEFTVKCKNGPSIPGEVKTTNYPIPRSGYSETVDISAYTLAAYSNGNNQPQETADDNNEN